jgi:deoxyuridine 5'-triphosphate nucleotidohydrolase
MGNALSTTFRDSVVWGDRDADSVVPCADADARQVGSEQTCVIPIELVEGYDNKHAVPQRATARAAGVDLHAAKSITIAPAATIGGVGTIVPTGIKLALDCDDTRRRLSTDAILYGDLRGRSSLALKGIRVFQGTIDADYRGEIGVVMFNDTNEDYHISAGDWIAQLLFKVALAAEVGQVADVATAFATDRGTGGFGSTGTGTGIGSP